MTALRSLATVTAWLALGNVAIADPAPCAEVRPITFATGRADATVGDALAPGELRCFSLAAKKGQAARLSVTSVEGNAVFQFYRPGWRLGRDEDGDLSVNGTAYPHAAEGEDARRWSGRLAASGDNLVVVGSTRGGADYRLHVSVSP